MMDRTWTAVAVSAWPITLDVPFPHASYSAEFEQQAAAGACWVRVERGGTLPTGVRVTGRCGTRGPSEDREMAQDGMRVR